MRHLKIISDNSTTIVYIYKQGGTTCNKLTKDIWIICMDKGTHVSAAHIPGKQNMLADIASTKFYDASEWMLSKNIFNHLIACFGVLISTFLRLDSISNCIESSWMFDPDFLYIDAMSIS